MKERSLPVRRRYSVPLYRQYNEGYWAFKKGALWCPYAQHSDEFREWQRGFNAAYFAK